MRGSASNRTAAIEWFLDREKVLLLVDSGRLKGLRKSGAYVRTSATRSIKKGKKASPAGSPPRTRKGFLKKDVFFALDSAAGNVFIGPVSYPTINRLQEEGGSAEFDLWADRRGKVRATLGQAPKRGGPWKRVGTRMQTYPKRAFMFPAVERSQDKITSFFADIL